MKDRRNYYRLLHVQPDAPGEIIRSSYKTMMQRMRMHPDLGGDDRSAAILNEAYTALRDPVARTAYDQSRQVHRGTASRKVVGKEARTSSGFLLECAFCKVSVDGGDDSAPPFCVNCQCPLASPKQSWSEDSDRRSVARVPSRSRVVFCTHWPQSEPHSGLVLDVSLGGMKFHSAIGLSIGQVIKIDTQTLRAVGRVTREQQAQSAWETGVEFLSLHFQRSRGSFIADRV